MTVNITKGSLNLREELSSLKKPSGVAGEAMLRADTPQEQFKLIGAGRRNLIINGDMRINQRGVTTTTQDVTNTVDFPSRNYATVDRFITGSVSYGDATAGRRTAVQVFEDGKYWTKETIEVGFVGTSYVKRGPVTLLEKQDVRHLYGKPATLSFLFKASLNGQYSVAIGSPNDQRFSIFSWDYVSNGEPQHVSFTFTVPKEWEQIEHSSNTGDTGQGIEFYFNYGVPSGSTLEGSTYVNGKWPTADGDLELTHTSDLKYWEIAGSWAALTEIQLEEGSVATPFEHRSFAEELALCQRYYEQSYGYGAVPGTNSSNGRLYAYGTTDSAACMGFLFQFKQQKRVIPDITFYHEDGTQGVWQYSGSTGSGAIGMNVGGLFSSSNVLCYSSPISSTFVPMNISGHVIADAEL